MNIEKTKQEILKNFKESLDFLFEQEYNDSIIKSELTKIENEIKLKIYEK